MEFCYACGPKGRRKKKKKITAKAINGVPAKYTPPSQGRHFVIKKHLAKVNALISHNGCYLHHLKPPKIHYGNRKLSQLVKKCYLNHWQLKNTKHCRLLNLGCNMICIAVKSIVLIELNWLYKSPFCIHSIPFTSYAVPGNAAG